MDTWFSGLLPNFGIISPVGPVSPTPLSAVKKSPFDATDNFHKELHYYYEKARYSKDGCSEEDAQKIIKGYKA